MMFMPVVAGSHSGVGVRTRAKGWRGEGRGLLAFPAATGGFSSSLWCGVFCCRHTSLWVRSRRNQTGIVLAFRYSTKPAYPDTGCLDFQNAVATCLGGRFVPQGASPSLWKAPLFDMLVARVLRSVWLFTPEFLSTCGPE